MQSKNLCTVHLKDLRFFAFLGANEHEAKIGQNLKIKISLKMPFENTNDDLDNTVDYGKVFEVVKQHIDSLGAVQLLEYFAEQILTVIGSHFPKICWARIKIQKGYVPLPHFTGKVCFIAQKRYY
jgi:FolB domain-containing protein